MGVDGWEKVMSVIGSEREGAKVLQAKAAAKERKGPCTNDVCSIFGISNPPCMNPSEY